MKLRTSSFLVFTFFDDQNQNFLYFSFQKYGDINGVAYNAHEKAADLEYENHLGMMAFAKMEA